MFIVIKNGGDYILYSGNKKMIVKEQKIYDITNDDTHLIEESLKNNKARIVLTEMLPIELLHEYFKNNNIVSL